MRSQSVRFVPASSLLVIAQTLILSIGLIAMVFAPPLEGEMVVLPLTSRPMGETINWVIRHNGRIVGQLHKGRMLVVSGNRGDLIGPALAHGALLAGLPSSSCGRPRAKNWR